MPSPSGGAAPGEARGAVARRRGERVPEAGRGRGRVGWRPREAGREPKTRGKKPLEEGEGPGREEGAKDKYGHPADSVRDDMRLAV